MKKIPLILLPVFVVIFFWQFLFKGLLPVPSDALVGLYHPFRDFYSKEYPRGLPFKNFLITDPVRQQVPWKKLTTDIEKTTRLPLWNPYSLSGTPLLGNFQGGAFYPLNILFFILPFSLAWSIFIFLQPILAGFFLFIYLRNLKLSPISCLLASVSFVFSGFSVAWLEWGNILHSALWLPLVLFSVDKFIYTKRFRYLFLFLVSLLFSYFAGYFQVFFYIFIISIAYIFYRLIQKKDFKTIFYFLTSIIFFFIFSLPQTIPTFRFYLESARDTDQTFLNPGWYIPLQHLAQFLVPDFFGNPSTMNYWGVWNYGELVGYVGLLPFLFAIFSLFSKKRDAFFFVIVIIFSLLFSTSNVLTNLIYTNNVPFISSFQPTRLIFLIVFSLSVLAGFGMEYFLENRKKIFIPLAIVIFIFVFLWIWYFLNKGDLNYEVTKNNLIYSTSLLFVCLGVLILSIFKKNQLLLYVVILIAFLDLVRFGWKFLPFTSPQYFFPVTRSIDFLNKDSDLFRVMSVDPELLAPNTLSFYKIQSLDGYDPLYARRYGELIAALERGAPNIGYPLGFNRIINPQTYETQLIDMMNVKYVLSLNDLKSEKLSKVFQEGNVRIYENKNVIPRAFLPVKTINVNTKQDAINALFSNKDRFSETAIVEGDIEKTEWASGSAKVKNYSENEVVIEIEADNEAFLVFTDSFLPFLESIG